MGISRLQKEWLNTKGTVKAHVLLFKLNLLRATPKEWLVFENVHLLQSKNNIQTPNIKYPEQLSFFTQQFLHEVFKVNNDENYHISKSLNIHYL